MIVVAETAPGSKWPGADMLDGVAEVAAELGLGFAVTVVNPELASIVSLLRTTVFHGRSVC